MKFISFIAGDDKLMYAGLFNDEIEAAHQEYMETAHLDLDDIGPYNRLVNKLNDHIFASIVLHTSADHKSKCHGAYELVSWAATKRGAGKILLFNLMNQGVKLIADRAMVSPLAKNSIMQMVKSPLGKHFLFEPLDSERRRITPGIEDDCETHTKFGGYYHDSHKDSWFSKLDNNHPYPDVMEVEDWMDFAFSMKSPAKPKVFKLGDIISDDYTSMAYEEAIQDHFDNSYASSHRGTRRTNNENVTFRKPLKITKGKLRRIIREEYARLKQDDV